MHIEEVKKNISKKASYEHWKSVGIFSHHGVNFPLFSLRSKKSCGIGEYTDLKLLVDFCKKVGLNVIQLLPLNEMGNDFNPYNAISSCALDPIYLGLYYLPFIDYSFLQELKTFEYINKNKQVDYIEVQKKKTKFLKRYFDLTYEKTSNTDHYITFIKQNKCLKPYTLFKVFYDKTKT